MLQVESQAARAGAASSPAAISQAGTTQELLLTEMLRY